MNPPSQARRAPSHLHVLYRTHPGSNNKSRPPWYTRGVALSSLRLALEAVSTPTTITFIEDGGLPPDLEPLIRPNERIIHIHAGTVASSYRKAVRVAQRLAKRDDGNSLYWIAEGDYLYRPTAMLSLVKAALLAPAGTCFTLYKPDDRQWHASHPSQPLRPVPQLEQPFVCAGLTWQRISSSTSTVGMMTSDVLTDARTLRLVSFTGAPFDGPCYLVCQGISPYDLGHLFADIDAGSGPRALAKAVVKPAMRVTCNALAARHRRSDRVVLSPETDLATHMEIGNMSDDYDWAALADWVVKGGQPTASPHVIN